MHDVVMKKTTALYRFVWLSRPLHQEVEQAVESLLAETPLTVRMRAVLEALLEHGPSSVPEIARVLQIKRQYVQLMMNEVFAAGFAERHENPGHKRSPKYTLTKSGDELLSRVRTKEQKSLHAMARHFSATEIETALKVMEGVLTHFVELNTGGTQ